MTRSVPTPHSPSSPRAIALMVASLGVLSLTPAFAENSKHTGADKAKAEKYEHGHRFEYAHPPKDSAEAHERRDNPNGPSAVVKGPHGRLTHVNRKMKGHSHHEDHPARSAAEAKQWQDNRMWRQTGTWQGGKDWNNARAKDWQAERGIL